MHELSIDEIGIVSGAGPKEAGAALGVAGTIGAAALGAGWGTMAVGAAFAASPLAVVAVVALAVYAGYELASK